MPSTARPPRPQPSRAARPRRRLAGPVAGLCAAVALVTPTPYLVESPGPTVDVLGSLDETPVITVSEVQEGVAAVDERETTGRLDLTTVMIGGPPTSETRLLDLLSGLLDPTADVVPAELVYPTGTTADQVTAQNTAAMTGSQDVAVAAALTELGIDYESRLSVAAFVPGGPAEGTLEVGDVLLDAAGTAPGSVAELKQVLNASDGEPVPVRVRRDGEELELRVPTAPAPAGSADRWLIGTYLDTEHTFPMDVQIALENIGGPSAGLVFALGVVDLLSAGDLTGGVHIAGTGTVDETGAVGPIGGIEQKVQGALASGATVFLAPELNCAELDGRVPEGIDVVSVATLGQARAVVESLGTDHPLQDVTRCG